MEPINRRSFLGAAAAAGIGAPMVDLTMHRSSASGRPREHLLLSAASSRQPSGVVGEQTVLVIRFNFADDRSEPFEATDVSSAMAVVSGFYRAASYGAAWLSGTVTPWVQTDIVSTSGANLGYWGWPSVVNPLAASLGFDPATYTRQIYLFPATPYVGFLGATTVSEPPVFLNGTIDQHVIAHELGHTFGLYHSHGGFWDGVDRWSEEYGDIYDTMGSGHLLHFNAFQKERLGWIGGRGNVPRVRTITKSGNYRLANYEEASGNPKALFWRTPEESFHHGGYGVYFEYRSDVGVLAHQGGEISFGSPVADDSTLLDLDPALSGTAYVMAPGAALSFAGMTATATGPDSLNVVLP